MKQGIHSRIYILLRFTMVAALLVAGLVILASRLPASQTPATSAADSPIHAAREPAADATQPVAAVPAAPTVLPTEAPPPVLVATPEPTPDVSNRIGILAGHWGYDSGAICGDGLREVDITVDIAQRTADQLRALGYEVDILREHHPDKPQPPLQNYQAAAFIALHADSCLPNTSGFKVSRWRFSQMPEIEDRLVECVYDRYRTVTGLSRHDDSITIDMWNYYAFREIGVNTPGAIIELGFMTGDRGLLVQQPDLVAKGVVDGLICFLRGAN